MNVNATQDEARLSEKLVAALEIASVVVSVLITVWVINPLQLEQRWISALPGILVLALMFHAHRAAGETLRSLGFRLENFWGAVRLLILPMLVVGTCLLGIGYWYKSLNFGNRFLFALAFVPFWGLAQQYVLQAFVLRRVQLILGAGQGNLAVAVAAAVFALVHAPNIPLVLLTLLGGLIWCWVYEREPNLFALGLSHGIMSALAMASLPPALLQSMSIGYKHLVFQRF